MGSNQCNISPQAPIVSPRLKGYLIIQTTCSKKYGMYPFINSFKTQKSIIRHAEFKTFFAFISIFFCDLFLGVGVGRRSLDRWGKGWGPAPRHQAHFQVDLYQTDQRAFVNQTLDACLAAWSAAPPSPRRTQDLNERDISDQGIRPFRHWPFFVVVVGAMVSVGVPNSKR